MDSHTTDATEPERLTFTVDEAAQVLGISRAHAYQLVRQKEIPNVKLGRRVVVPRKALEELLRDGVKSWA